MQDKYIDRLLYGKLTKNDVEKYAFLIDIDVEDLKETLKDLSYNYFKYYIINDGVNFKENARELNKYLDLNIPAINDFINYCFVISSYQILNKIYDNDFNFYYPTNPDLNIKGYKQRSFDNFVKKHGLNQNQVNEIIEYNKKRLDIDCLKELEKYLEDSEKTNFIKLDAPAIDGVAGYLNNYFTGDFDIITDLKINIFVFASFAFELFMDKSLIKDIYTERDKPITNYINIDEILDGGSD